MTAGVIIRRRREELSLSQAELASRVGIKQQSLLAIEQGRTQKSRHLPKIAQVLGLRFVDLDPSFAVSEHDSFISQHLPVVGERNLPVYAAAEAGSGALVLSTEPVDFVRRPAPLASVRDSYALIVVGESMIPAFEPGDMLLVHPHLPPVAGCDVVLYRERHGEVLVSIKRLRRVTPTHWHLTQWNPPDDGRNEFTLLRTDWQKCHRVVGKYSRR